MAPNAEALYDYIRQNNNADSKVRRRGSLCQSEVVLLPPASCGRSTIVIERVVVSCRIADRLLSWQPTQSWMKSNTKNAKRKMRRSPPLPLTVTLRILVFLDMFAVSLVVPLLFQYYAAAGVTVAHQREFLSSLFYISQIVGGLVMGICTNVYKIQRKTLLLVSFGGSAVSYALMGWNVHNTAYGGGQKMNLAASRLLVGLVKQTMTITAAMLASDPDATQQNSADARMGRLNACSTVAWIAGPSTGALLFKYVDPAAPAIVAALLFVVNMVLATFLIERVDDAGTGMDKNDQDGNNNKIIDRRRANSEAKSTNNRSIKNTVASLIGNTKTCFTLSPVLTCTVLAKLIFTWVYKATSYSQLGSFYEDMYGLEPHHRGYIQSYQQCLMFLMQSFAVQPVLQVLGDKRRSVVLCTIMLAIAILVQSRQSLWLFLVVLCPILALGFSIITVSLITLVSLATPSHSIFSIFAIQDVLQNAVSVTVPFYRTALFRYVGLAKKDAASLSPTPSPVGAIGGMQDDPDPVAWILYSSLHWLLAAATIAYLLLANESKWNHVYQRHTTKKGQ